MDPHTTHGTYTEMKETVHRRAKQADVRTSNGLGLAAARSAPDARIGASRVDSVISGDLEGRSPVHERTALRVSLRARAMPKLCFKERALVSEPLILPMMGDRPHAEAGGSANDGAVVANRICRPRAA